MIFEQQTYNVGIYLRFSRDEQGESDSIATQRTMLNQYCADNGFKVTNEYCDDGWSGSSFDRPNFQRMIDDIYAKKINLVLTKDLSRFGRNYVQAGFYMDEVFSRHNVRFIAIKDNVDTLVNDVNNDIIVPFKNIINDLYVRDTSRKVKAAKDARAKSGLNMCARPPHGYLKSPDNKNKLVVDEEAAEVVRMMFKLASEGNTLSKIIKALSDTPTPAQYFMSKFPDYYKKPPQKYNVWGYTTVRQILENPVYLGKSIHGKTRSMRIRTQAVIRPKDEWIVVENTHKPLVTQELWDIVQEVIKAKRRPLKDSDSVQIFAGLLKCGDCGLAMGYHRKQGTTGNYVCSSYNKYGKDICQSHYINYKKLHQTVLDSIRELAQAACKNETALLKIIEKESKADSDGNAKKSSNEIGKVEARIGQLDIIIKKLYEDSVLGAISQERLYLMMSDYEAEQQGLKKRLTMLQQQKQEQTSQKSQINTFIEAIKEQADITELDALTLNKLISKIEIGHAEVNPETKRKEQKISVTYKFYKTAQELSVAG